MKTEKLTFEDDSWWEFRAGLTVGMAEAVDAATRPFRKLSDPSLPRPGPAAILTGEAKAPEYEIDLEKIDGAIVDAALVLAATRGWSYGPVDIATLKSEVPQAHYLKVLGRLQELLLPFLSGAGTGSS